MVDIFFCRRINCKSAYIYERTVNCWNTLSKKKKLKMPVITKSMAKKMAEDANQCVRDGSSLRCNIKPKNKSKSSKSKSKRKMTMRSNNNSANSVTCKLDTTTRRHSCRKLTKRNRNASRKWKKNKGRCEASVGKYYTRCRQTHLYRNRRRRYLNHLNGTTTKRRVKKVDYNVGNLFQ